MGGLILGNYLARRSEKTRSFLSAVKIMSVLWDVHKGSASIEKPVIMSTTIKEFDELPVHEPPVHRVLHQGVVRRGRRVRAYIQQDARGIPGQADGGAGLLDTSAARQEDGSR